VNAAACGLHLKSNAAPDPAYQNDIVITEAEIASYGLQSAFDVVKRRAPQLNFRENNRGEPTRGARHGRSSIMLNEAPLLFVDDVRMSDLAALDQIPASTVASIRILSGLSGTTYYGTNAGGGVILIRTKT